MKIRITRNELLEVLSGYFRVDVTDFFLEPSGPSVLGAQLRKSLIEPEKCKLTAHNARTLRIVGDALKVKINLIDTKWALENWETWINFVDSYNRFPSPGYGSQARLGELR